MSVDGSADGRLLHEIWDASTTEGLSIRRSSREMAWLRVQGSRDAGQCPA